jgi:aspartate aminotransferase
MFETGIELKQKYGEENVFDFSLGNPDLPSPEKFNEILVEEAKKRGPYVHGYMPNAGYSETREVVAAALKRESGIDFTKDEIIMTCGAAGALNVILKSILEPDDEAIVIAPYFGEYDFYIDNHQGIRVISNSNAELLPNFSDLDSEINPKTKALLINTPNNPSGRVYSSEILSKFGEILSEESKILDHPIYLIVDEPYKKIIFDGLKYNSPFKFYKNTIIANSFSKDLSLAGERIGYLAISPLIEDVRDIVNASIFCNRILGYVNAPALMQRIVKNALDLKVEVEIYQKRRDILYNALKKIGFDVIKPEGTFYIFPKTPIDDDIKFVKSLQDELILATPGTGFHYPGYIRLSFCVPEKTIINAFDKFEKVYKMYS